MKKTTTFFLIIGVLAMIIGGIGSIVYFKRAENSMTDTEIQKYEIKNKQKTKEIHLNLSGNAEFYILTDNSNEIVMNTRSSMPVSIKSSLDVKETDNQLTISANSDKRKNGLERSEFSIFNQGSAVTLTIPDDTERLVIEGKADGIVNLSGVTTKDLSLKINNADLSVNNSHTEKLALETTNGNLVIPSDVRADEATFKTTNGDIQVDNFSASNWSAISTSGDISMNKVKGIAKIETTNGEIQATDFKGEANVKSINGDFALYGTEIPKKLLVETQRGDINLYTEEIIYDVTITTKTKVGESIIFGKERNSFKKGNGKNSFALQTNYGDISVEGPSDYEDSEND